MTVSADAQSRMQGTAASGFESVSQVYEPGPEVETMAEENTRLRVHGASLVFHRIGKSDSAASQQLSGASAGTYSGASPRPFVTMICPTLPS
jgi:hypothetical protein